MEIGKYRNTYFEDATKWDRLVAARACVLLEQLYDVYKEDSAMLEPSVPKPPTPALVFIDAVRNLTPAQQKAAITELEAYFNNANPCLDGDALKWWKVNLSLPNLFLSAHPELIETCRRLPSPGLHCQRHFGHSRCEHFRRTTVLK